MRTNNRLKISILICINLLSVIDVTTSDVIDWSSYFDYFNHQLSRFQDHFVNLNLNGFGNHKAFDTDKRPLQDNTQLIPYRDYDLLKDIHDKTNVHNGGFVNTFKNPNDFVRGSINYNYGVRPQYQIHHQNDVNSFRPIESSAYDQSNGYQNQPSTLLQQEYSNVLLNPEESILYQDSSELNRPIRDQLPQYEYRGPYVNNFDGYYYTVANEWKPTCVSLRRETQSYMFSHPPAESSPHRTKLLDRQPIVMTDKGLIRGNKMVSRSGDEYYAFTSIPYAEPPLGQLRFEKPTPAKPWNAVRDGPEDLPDCWQIQVLNPYMNNVTYGTEDCLYLSVFTPEINAGRKYPVMFYIHGGAYRSEFPSVGKPNKADYLLEEDIVLVIIRYRLGAFGFLSLEDKLLPGNMGLKDSALALDWVSKNIETFSGDPTRVTVFGNSVGGSTVQYLMTSPMTKHLVHRGISQSGTATSLWALGPPGVGRYRASRLAEHLKCPTTPDKELIECLKSKPAFDIADAEKRFIIRYFDPPILYPPVVEKGEDCLVCQSPFHVPVEKPWMVGVTKDEGAFAAAWFIAKPDLMKSFREHGADFLPEGIMFMNTTSYVRQISDSIMDFYHGQTIGQVEKIYTDGYFFSSMMQSLNKVASSPAYMYLLTHRGEVSNMDILAKIGRTYYGDLGVSHTDELLYIFNYEDDLKFRFGQKDIRVSRSLVKLWTNFAKHGRPTKHDEWPQYDRDCRRYLNIASENLRVETNLWPERAEFWESLPIRNIMEEHGL